jgi:prepilin-type N-terminal cleavage/methylation domain-containing protein
VSRRLTDLGRAQQGFTLIEVLMTALVVTLIAGAVAGGLVAGTKYTSTQHLKSEAETLAQQDQERMKGLSAAQLNNLNQTYTATLDNKAFTVTSKAWYLNNAGGPACAAGAASATYFKTISTVTQTNGAGVTQTLATDESIIAPPAGGSLLAKFQDQTLSPLSGVTVAATGPESDTGTSDANGCVIFSGMQTGNYTLTYTDAGYVDKDGNPSPLTDSANVASTGQATPLRANPIKLGQAGGINASFATTAYNNAATPALTNYAAQATALSWIGSGSSLSMSQFRTATSALASTIWTTTTTGSTGGLFPFASLNPTSYANNYQLWAGKCQQEQPPAGVNAATVNPGSVQNPLTIQEAPLYLVVKYNGAAVAPANVKITFTNTSGSACTETWGPYTTPGPNGPSGTNVVGGASTYVYVAPFASSATSGSQASASGQTGQLTVCADHRATSGTWYHNTATTTDSFTAPTLPLTPTTVAVSSTTSPTGTC